MEQLSISSFLQNGHDYHLYVYDEVKNVPAGTVVRNANEILPAVRIFQYKDRPSYASAKHQCPSTNNIPISSRFIYNDTQLMGFQVVLEPPRLRSPQ
jgi:hypothetical protein